MWNTVLRLGSLVPLLLLGGAVHLQAQRFPGIPSISTDDAGLELERTIGEAFGSPEYEFWRISGIAVDEGGSLWILDSRERRIDLFTSDGAHVCGFGSEGVGPGEFRLPTSIRVDSVVRVYDPALNRETVFSRSCELLSASGIDLDAPVADLVRIRDRVVGRTTSRISYGHPSHDPYHVLFTSAPGLDRDTLLVMHSGATIRHPPEAVLPWGAVDSPFGRGGAWALSGDSLLATMDGYTGEVVWYAISSEGLRRTRTADIGLQAPPVSDDDISELASRVREEEEERVRGRFELAAPPHWSVARRGLFAGDGSLWIETVPPEAGGPIWTVFPAGGERRRYRLPAGFHLGAVVEDRMIGVCRTELEVERVCIYRSMRRDRH